MDRKLRTIFLVSGIFTGKIDSVMLLGFECTINVKHFIKIFSAIFEEIEIFIFFLRELPLILTVRLKWKKRELRYLHGDSGYRI